jgi:hypothetical protein
LFILESLQSGAFSSKHCKEESSEVDSSSHIGKGYLDHTWDGETRSGHLTFDFELSYQKTQVVLAKARRAYPEPIYASDALADVESKRRRRSFGI